MEKPQATIAEMGEGRIDKIPFRPDHTRVLKPQQDADLSDVAYTAEDRAAYKLLCECGRELADMNGYKNHKMRLGKAGHRLMKEGGPCATSSS